MPMIQRGTTPFRLPEGEVVESLVFAPPGPGKAVILKPDVAELGLERAPADIGPSDDHHPPPASPGV